MEKNKLLPDYLGLWTKKEEDLFGEEYFKYGIFSMWKKEKGVGKIWEMYLGELKEADLTKLVDNKLQISFIKKYTKQHADLLKGNLTYSGIGNGDGFYDGKWTGKNIDGKERRGEFFLADVKKEWAVEELGKIIGGLHLRDFDLRVRDLQEQFSYTPII